MCLKCNCSGIGSNASGTEHGDRIPKDDLLTQIVTGKGRGAPSLSRRAAMRPLPTSRRRPATVTVGTVRETVDLILV